MHTPDSMQSLGKVRMQQRLLNHLKDRAKVRGPQRLVGRYTEDHLLEREEGFASTGDRGCRARPELAQNTWNEPCPVRHIDGPHRGKGATADGRLQRTHTGRADHRAVV